MMFKYFTHITRLLTFKGCEKRGASICLMSVWLEPYVLKVLLLPLFSIHI